MSSIRAAGKRLASDTPPSGISGWSSKPLQSISTSYSSSSLTRQVRSATKQNGQMKSEYSVTTMLMICSSEQITHPCSTSIPVIS